MAKTIRLDDDVRRALGEATIEGATLRLASQLGPDLYRRVKKVIESAGGKWNRGRGFHEFESDPRAILGLAVSTGRIENRRQAIQQFYTPAPLAKRMVELAGIRGKRLTVLEPSAGEGAIADAIAAAGCDPYCLEIDPANYDILAGKGYTSGCVDFLRWHTPQTFRAILMNPPFAGDQDIAHVERALTMLAPGGVLVAITSARFTFARTAACTRFRRLVDEHTCEILPGGTFAASGTNVQSALLTIRH